MGCARVAEMVDALDLGSSSPKGSVGSNPSSCTSNKNGGLDVARVDSLFQLHVSSESQQPTGTLHVTIPATVIDTLYEHTLDAQKAAGPTAGFNQQEVPIHFLDAYYHENVINHLKEFLLKYAVIGFVYRQLARQRILSIGEPRLENIFLEQHKPAVYTFAFTAAQPTLVHDWKRLLFKAPLRKRYQDIDKQATNFLTQEKTNQKNYTNNVVVPGDWVLFEVSLVGVRNNVLVKNFSEKLWLQISDEESSEPFRSLFIGKKVNDCFVTDCPGLNDFFGSQLNNPYSYIITIKSILPIAYFCIDSFRGHFRLSSERKAHQKMVEVYSFRNDMSLRRSMVEELLALLLKTYPLEIPESAILRQEKLILDELQQNPDYAIYKLQHDFSAKVRALADKQVRECLITLLLAEHEDLEASDDDICFYMNLTKRARTKEFIYFVHPAVKSNDEDVPIFHDALRYYCIHEKALNYMLCHLLRNQGG